jgi:hypothetical protein
LASFFHLKEEIFIGHKTDLAYVCDLGKIGKHVFPSQVFPNAYVRQPIQTFRLRAEQEHRLVFSSRPRE